MPARHLQRDRRAQFRQPQIMRIERLATAQRLHGSLSDECRGDFIAFPKPEGEHVTATQCGIGDFANL